VRFVVSSDWHVDATTGGLERLPEMESYVDELCAYMRENQIDAFMHLGDLWDPGTLSDARWGRFVARSMLDTVRSTTSGTSLWIAGNHDVVDVVEPTSILSPLRVLAAHMDGVHVAVREMPSLVWFPEQAGKAVAVLALPYVSLLVERSPAYAGAIAEAFGEAREAVAKGHRLVVVGHLSFDGMHPGSEEEMTRGREVAFPVAEVAALRPTLVLNGHYHERQTIRRGVAPLELDVEIVGAPLRLTFGDAAVGRGFLVAEV